MNKEFVPYEESLALKELGFDESCYGCYSMQRKVLITQMTSKRSQLPDGHKKLILPSPLYQQAFRWFRDEYDLVVSIFYCGDNKSNKTGIQEYSIVVDGFGCVNVCYEPDLSFKTYEEAELACLRKLIEIVKQNN